MTSPFLPNYREFPTDDEHNLQKQLVNFHRETNTAVNNRTISTFQTNSIPNGERWYPNPNQQRLRDGNRVTLRFSSILNGVTTIPHGVTWVQNTRLYGNATNGTLGIPLEHSTAAEVISLSVDQTNVYITTTTANWVAYYGTVVFEFLGS